jgi:hypothetical protein
MPNQAGSSTLGGVQPIGGSRRPGSPGSLLRWPALVLEGTGAVWYHVYGNTGQGDPITYASPLATITGPPLTWTSPMLAYPSTWSFGVRAFYAPSGLEEQNVDCVVTIILDSGGNDITNRPVAPTGLRCTAVAHGGIKCEWAQPPPKSKASAPSGFHVYIGTGGTPNYGSPAATVSASSAIANSYVTTIGGLMNGTTYTIGVRAFNAIAEEPNTYTVNCTAVSVGPTAVVGLTGTAV